MSPIKNEEEAVDAIAEFANGAGFEKKGVERLARYFKSMIFKSPVSGGAEGVRLYWVGFFVDSNNPDSKPDRIEFSTEDTFGVQGTNRSQIHKALVVPTVPGVRAPPLVSRKLDFSNPADGPKVVITTQLQGCTFAIGVAGDDYLMSHAMPAHGAQGVTGFELAEAIHRDGPRMFQDETPTSTFLIHPGSTIDKNSGFGYGDTDKGYKASILGLVVKNTSILTKVSKSKVTYSLSFIVAVIKDQNSIEEVVVITHKDSKWKVEVTK